VLAEPVQLNTNLGRYTNFMNLLDLYGLAIPAGFRSDGIPFGVTLAAPAWRENLLFNLAREFEGSPS
jgi:allophanate hydrolase